MSEALRQILAVFKVDNTSLKQGMKEGNKLVDDLKKGLKELAAPLTGLFTGAGLLYLTHDLIAAADATAKLAQSFGLGIVELQGWKHAADLSGIETELLRATFGKLQLQLNEVATKGAGPAAEALKVLGIDVENSAEAVEQGAAKLKTAGQVIEEVADAIQGMEAGKRNPQLMKIFGEQGAKLVPLIKDGSAGVREMRKEIEDLGFVFDQEFADSAELFGDNVDRLTKAGKGFWLQALKPMLPELVKLTEELIKGAKAVIPMVRGFVDFVRHTKLLQAALILLTGKGLLVGAAAMRKWAIAAGGLRGILLSLARVVLRFLLPLALLEDALVFLAGGKSKLGKKLDDWFGPGTSGAVREFFQAFVNAPDDIRKAFASLPADLKREFGALGEFFGDIYTIIVDEFLFMVDVLTGGWSNFTSKMTAMGDWLLAALSIVWTELRFAGLGVAAAIQDAFANAWNSIIAGAQRAIKAVADAASHLPLTGKAISEGLNSAADTLGGLKGKDGHASADVQKQLQDARMAIVGELESAETRMVRPSQSTLNEKDRYYDLMKKADVQYRETIVNVTIPPGASAKDIAMIKHGAREAAMQGVRAAISEDRRATHAALVPRTAG